MSGLSGTINENLYHVFNFNLSSEIILKCLYILSFIFIKFFKYVGWSVFTSAVIIFNLLVRWMKVDFQECLKSLPKFPTFFQPCQELFLKYLQQFKFESEEEKSRRIKESQYLGYCSILIWNKSRWSIKSYLSSFFFVKTKGFLSTEA